MLSLHNSDFEIDENVDELEHKLDPQTSGNIGYLKDITNFSKNRRVLGQGYCLQLSLARGNSKLEVEEKTQILHKILRYFTKSFSRNKWI